MELKDKEKIVKVIGAAETALQCHITFGLESSQNYQTDKIFGYKKR